MGLIRIGVLVLMVLFLTGDLVFGQNNAKQILTKGMKHAAQGNFTEAKEEFEKALKIDPYYGSAKRALEVIEDALDQKIKSKTAIHLFKGIAYGYKEQLVESIAEINKAIEINPRFAAAYTHRGIAYKNKGQYDKAISDYNKAIEINPWDVKPYNNRGVAYFNKGQYDQAISDFNKAIEINPSYADTYYNRGNAYGNKGQYDKAIANYNKTIEINARDAMAYNNRGVAYFYKREYEKAWDDVYKAESLGYKVHPGFLKALHQASLLRQTLPLQ